MNLASKYLDTTCRSYEEMQQRLKLNIPESFNFGFDIVDEYARLCPEKRALVWCNDKGEEKSFTFGEISALSNKLARDNFQEQDIKAIAEALNCDYEAYLVRRDSGEKV